MNESGCMGFRREKERKKENEMMERALNGRQVGSHTLRSFVEISLLSKHFLFFFFFFFFSKSLFTLITKILYTTQHFLSSSHVFLFFLFSIINYCIYIFSIHKVHQKILNLSSHFLTKLILILSHLH
jgi:hypothetical protein